MAKKEDTLEESTMNISVAYLHDPVMMPGASGLKTLNVKENPKLKLSLVRNDLLKIEAQGRVGYVRNWKLLIE